VVWAGTASHLNRHSKKLRRPSCQTDCELKRRAPASSRLSLSLSPTPNAAAIATMATPPPPKRLCGRSLLDLPDDLIPTGGASWGHTGPWPPLPSVISEEATACLMPLRSSATTRSDQLGHRPATPSTRRHTAITW
jgi:hypothetical protein